MSTITVYRTFYWTGDRLAGQTDFVWPTKEVRARCIKEAPPGYEVITGHPWPKSTNELQERDASYHIRNQTCLCGVHGYWSPNYLSLTQPQTRPGSLSEYTGNVVIGRLLLFGLVDIRSQGARGEYGTIEELWCNESIANTVEERYHVPVNRSKYTDQKRTDPILDKDITIKRLAPLFSELSEIMAIVNASLAPITPSPLIGAKIIVTPKIITSPIVFPGLWASSSPLNTLRPGGPLPLWTSKLMRDIYNKQYAATIQRLSGKHSALCPAASGASQNCQCGSPKSHGISCLCTSCRFMPTTVKLGNPSNVPQIVPIVVDTAYNKPGIVKRIVRWIRGW